MIKKVISVAVILSLGAITYAQENAASTPVSSDKPAVQDAKKTTPTPQPEAKTQAEQASKKTPDYSKTTTTTTTTKTVTKTTKPEEAKPKKKKSGINPAYCFARGLTNITFCWLELPRCMIYDNAQIPFFGLLVGIPEGVIFTVARAFTGVFDIITLGFSGEALHGPRFPDFVFQSNWLPPDDEE
ncbi:MAG: hypothetical protein GY750_11075 [Lentisphaerae bacterium]|nr:hypothetical protein [Lentisphaerota bacterium]MCP4101954.1 hypothetical protein [Lentisphaerota bacterium]